MGLFGIGKKNKEKTKEKMENGLRKTRTGFWGNIVNALTGAEITDDLYDELEEQLILADVGADVALHLVERLREEVKKQSLKTGDQAMDALRAIIQEEMEPAGEMDLSGHPAVILVIGVNGVGKTTSIAKLAHYYREQGRRVMLAAGDTFRAAASEQLDIWAGRAGVPIVKAGEGADPAAVIFDTVKSAEARGYDMVIADTAGRLHNKANLMAELSKISRSVRKAAPDASLETLLVLDAITGQNAISQAREFCKAADASGVILTKLDGKPAVILVIGVNGVGKTTSIAKLARYYQEEGRKVMLAAGDTFRAAASEQLDIWAGRAGVPIVKAGEGADPAAVIFDTVKSAQARGYDMVIADTAGRLHNKANLMAELSKISRSVRKAAPEASLETLLVLDAITGQNAISQAREFCKAADASGVILTKLDGTAKGGCVVAVKQRLGLPVRFIGVGEAIDDLLPFDAAGFVEELLPRKWRS